MSATQAKSEESLSKRYKAFLKWLDEKNYDPESRNRVILAWARVNARAYYANKLADEIDFGKLSLSTENEMDYEPTGPSKAHRN